MISRSAKILILIFLIAAAAAIFVIKIHYQIGPIQAIPKFTHSSPQIDHKQNLDNKLSASTTTSSTLPSHLLLKVPFTTQAPFANWDQLHNEACEEANSFMASRFFAGDVRATIPPQEADNEIKKLVAWENQNFGYSLDTTSAETAEMINQVYGLQTKLLENFTEENIKQELNQNHLVIISEYGRALHNPNYKQPGPIHHMLLVKGYDGDSFITNDSGTRNGLNYVYDFQTIKTAAADWDHSTNNVNLNKKIAIVVWK